MTNYTISDVVHILLFLSVWFIVFSIQGFVLGQLTNVLDFRSSSLFKKLCLSNILALGIIPSLYYLTGKIGGLQSVSALVIILLVTALVLFLGTDKFQLNTKTLFLEIQKHNYLFIGISIWIILALLSLVDFQIGNKLYLSITAIDNAGKVAITDAICRTGIPPANPMFFPGHPVPFYYCYYWTLLCASISTLCQSAFDTRFAVLSGILWTGCTLIVFLPLLLDYFGINESTKRKAKIFSLFLLLVSGLNILVVLPSNIRSWFIFHKIYVSDMAWWANDQINLLTSEMIWTPHHIAGLIAGTLGSILLLETSSEKTFKLKFWPILLSGICLATSFGSSAYIGLGFAASWVIWGLLSLFSKKFVDLITAMSAATIAFLFSLPLLTELSHARQCSAPLALGIRRFDLMDRIIPHFSHAPRFVHQTVDLFGLPLNYLFGFGFIMFAAYMFWYKKENRKLIASRKQLFLIIIASTGLLLGAFIKSVIRNNDFGWRVLMLPNVAFLLWSAQYLAQLNDEKKKLSLIGQGLLYLGVFGFVYGFVLDRISPPLAENTVSSKQSYAWRKIYEDLNKKLPQAFIVQHNPQYDFFACEPFFSYYSHRQVVASDDQVGTNFGPRPNDYFKVAREVSYLYENPPLDRAIKICHQYKINVIVIKNTDNIWSNKAGWIYKFPVVAKNDYACAFQIQP